MTLPAVKIPEKPVKLVSPFELISAFNVRIKAPAVEPRVTFPPEPTLVVIAPSVVMVRPFNSTAPLAVMLAPVFSVSEPLLEVIATLPMPVVVTVAEVVIPAAPLKVTAPLAVMFAPGFRNNEPVLEVIVTVPASVVVMVALVVKSVTLLSTTFPLAAMVAPGLIVKDVKPA